MQLNYRAVGNRCAVHFDSLQLPISNSKALKILEKQGFKVIKVDMMSLSRACIKTSKYRRGALPCAAPATMDCSSFIKWLYGQRGIWLPRRSIQQREFGETVNLDQIIEGDVIFVKGTFDWYRDDPKDGVGHVGIITKEKTVIHACDRKVNVIESPLDTFISELKFRGIRRYVPQNTTVITLEVPPHKLVETSDDLRWFILQELPY